MIDENWTQIQTEGKEEVINTNNFDLFLLNSFICLKNN